MDSMARYLLISATSSIGTEVAKRLHQKGHELFLTSRSEEKIAPLLELTHAPYAIIDPANFDGVLKVAQEAKAKMGGLDGAVNFSGSLLLKGAHSTTFEEYQKTIEASLTSAFALVRAACTVMDQGGSIVLLSSAASLEGLPFHEAIAAAKGGINALTLSSAATYAAKKIRVNAVAPGLTRTSMTEHLFKNSESLHISEKMHPIGRLGEPKDIAAAVEFFLDPQNDWVTGQILAIDGGLSRIKKGG